MEMTFKLFEIQGMTENIDALEFYSKVFMNVPICSPAEFNSAYGQESEICMHSIFIVNRQLLERLRAGRLQAHHKELLTDQVQGLRLRICAS